MEMSFVIPVLSLFMSLSNSQDNVKKCYEGFKWK